MSDSALSEAIGSLTGPEIKAFRRCLQSPAFTLRSVMLDLFEYFLQQHLKEECPDRKRLAEILNTNDDKKTRREMSALLDLLRDFWAWEELKKDKARQALYQLRAASRRGLEKNYNLALKEAEKATSETGEASLQRPFLDFQLKMEKYHWDLSHHRGQIFPFDLLTDELTSWYAGQLLQLSCMAQAQGSVQRQYQAEWPDWVESSLEKLMRRAPAKTSAVALYQLGHRMLLHPDQPSYTVAFRELLEKNMDKIPADEARGLLMLAINHGIRRINEGNREAIRMTKDFYTLGLESKWLQDERGLLSKYTYNNALMTFLALSEWEDAKSFLEKYRHQLPSEERDNAYRYNLSIYHFRRGDFSECLDLLRDVSFPDPMYNLESRKMLLKIYYEQSSFDALESLLESLLTWLRRHGELGYHREMYRNLAVFTGRLLRLPLGDKEGRMRLRKKVQEMPLVAERVWLLEKIGK